MPFPPHPGLPRGGSLNGSAVRPGTLHPPTAASSRPSREPEDVRRSGSWEGRGRLQIMHVAHVGAIGADGSPYWSIGARERSTSTPDVPRACRNPPLASEVADGRSTPTPWSKRTKLAGTAPPTSGLGTTWSWPSTYLARPVYRLRHSPHIVPCASRSTVPSDPKGPLGEPSPSPSQSSASTSRCPTSLTTEGPPPAACPDKLSRRPHPPAHLNIPTSHSVIRAPPRIAR